MRDVFSSEQEPFQPGAITDWLETDQRPESLYQLLGFSLLDPDFGALASALNTSVRELLPYQNHSTPGIVRKAVELQVELGNAANILQSRQEFEKHRRAALELLTEESAQKFGDGDADPDALRKWLQSKHNCHADAIEPILTALGSQHTSSHDQQQDQSATDAPVGCDDQTRKAGDVGYLKRAFDSVKVFISRQMVPAFLLFYRDHWQELLRHVRDGLSQPTDNELWIRGSDPSPGVCRGEHVWDIDAAHHCVICGRPTDEPRRRVRSVVRDYDGMVYGLLVTVVVTIVVRIATASSIAAIASLFMGLWCARRLIVEEKVQIDCSTCAKHAGREETLLSRLKRDTLIVELGGRNARRDFLRKSREVSRATGWESQPPATGQGQPGFGSLAPPVFGGGDAESDPLDADHSTEPLIDMPVDPSGTDSPADEAAMRIPIADSDDSSPVEFRTFTTHDSDGVSFDAPIASKQESHGEPPSHYFQSRAIDTDETGDPLSAQGSTTEPTDKVEGGAETGNVLIPESEGPVETIPLATVPAAASESNGRWFVKIDGVEIGPVPLEQVRQLKSSGTFKQTDLVRREHESNWSDPDSVAWPEASPPIATSDDKKKQDVAADPESEPTDDSDTPWDPWAE